MEASVGLPRCRLYALLVSSPPSWASDDTVASKPWSYRCLNRDVHGLLFESPRPGKKMNIQGSSTKADSTLRSSRAVPHPSTNRALRRLTSEVGRDPVYSTWYGRQRATCQFKTPCNSGGPSYQASVHLNLDAVMCCVAVCYHKYMDA